VQPCGEPCGSAAGFDFLTLKVKAIEKNARSSQRRNLCQLFSAPKSMPVFSTMQLGSSDFAWAELQQSKTEKYKNELKFKERC